MYGIALEDKKKNSMTYLYEQAENTYIDILNTSLDNP